jgi:rare lipoprotein A
MGKLCAVILAAGLLTVTAGVQANTAPARVQPQTGNVPAGQAVTKSATTAKPHRRSPIVGRASWYGRKFHGKKTANGERYNMYELTAATRNLPLGSYAKVTNLKNHRWVLVRINDRGPMVDGRIIDLSYGAAQALDMTEKGVDTVAIQPISADGTASAMLNLQ